MDRQIKIRVIDRKDTRRNNICKAIKPFNSLGNACRKDFYENGNIISETDIDIFLLHINDQEDKKGNSFDGFLKAINKDLPDALIVLYSGGGISVTEHTNKKINITQEKKWNFDVENGNQFCIVKRNISKASDLNITEALRKYIATSSKDDFFKLILEPGKPHLIALSILCQGYLAANEEHLKEEKKIIKLPEGISISKDKKENTRKRDWWKPALGEGCEGGDLENELESVDKDKTAIECLREIIHNKEDGKGNKYFENGKATDSHILIDGKINGEGGFTEKVNAAYKQIKDILGATK